jgi:hypothetical protein
MGYDPKHPLWSKPSDPLSTIRNATAKAKIKTESILEALSGSAIVKKYAAKGQSWEGATNKPKGYTSPPNRVSSTTPSTSTGTKPISGTKPKSQLKQPKVTLKKAGTFRKIAGAIAGYSVARAFSSAGPVGRMVGAHLGNSLARRIATRKIKS